MPQTKLHTLAHVGQSVWLDFTERSFVASGGLLPDLPSASPASHSVYLRSRLIV